MLEHAGRRAVALHVEIDAPDTSSLSRRHLAGRMPTVVLVHGFSLSMQCWVLQRRALVQRRADLQTLNDTLEQRVDRRTRELERALVAVRASAARSVTGATALDPRSTAVDEVELVLLVVVAGLFAEEAVQPAEHEPVAMGDFDPRAAFVAERADCGLKLGGAEVRRGGVDGEVSTPTATAGPPVAAAAGRSMPMRTSSRWASTTCSGDSPSRVRGVPHGISQPR